MKPQEMTVVQKSLSFLVKTIPSIKNTLIFEKILVQLSNSFLNFVHKGRKVNLRRDESNSIEIRIERFREDFGPNYESKMECIPG